MLERIIMGRKDPRIDAYIEKSQDFAKPILTHLRKLVHQACSDVEETIKWGFPHFDYKGMMCSMASFKNHSSVSFWKAAIMVDPHKLMSQVGETSMGSFGKLADISDLPADTILLEYIKEAARLNDEGIKLPVSPKKAKKDMKIPGYFIEAISKNKKALETFRNFNYSNQKEYVEWIVEAKTEDTRKKRLNTAVEWFSEGKVRNWKDLKK
jgi:uncharacterized protein YdeI (YjbR/CyaY-like superfamily)